MAPFGRRRADDERRGTPADLLVVGLGNPCPQYAGSRHNVGADAVLRLADRHAARLRREKHAKADTDEVNIEGRRLALAVPLTYMNESGQAVAPLCRRFGIDDPARLVIIHDELDLEPGRVKVKAGGGLAGHNGLRSIKAHLHDDAFTRIRIGVGKPPSKEQGADHVLTRLGKRDRETLAVAIETAADAVEQIMVEGVEATMATVNAVR